MSEILYRSKWIVLCNHLLIGLNGCNNPTVDEIITGNGKNGLSFASIEAFGELIINMRKLCANKNRSLDHWIYSEMWHWIHHPKSKILFKLLLDRKQDEILEDLRCALLHDYN